MSGLKILIVEDEMIISESIRKSLLKLNYNVVGVASKYIRAIEMLESLEVNLVLIDINLNGLKNGIDLAKHIQDNYNIPFIYVTANNDFATLQKAKCTHPLGYLVKPFSEENLHSAIEVASFNFSNSESKPEDDFLFVKSGGDSVKLYLNQITVIHSKQNYLIIDRVNASSITVRGTLSDFLLKSHNLPFVKVSRASAINLAHLTEVNSEFIKVGYLEIPYSDSHKKDIIHQWKNYLGE